jgi:flagellar export protein FliJ
MKRFQFPLDRVRRWRAEQAALEELKLERLYGQLAALADEKRNIEDKRTASERQVLEQASMEGGELQALDIYRSHVRSRIGQMDQRQREVTGEIEVQRQKLIEARRQAELLERLKDKKLGEWRALAAREEETIAGELYLAKWRRTK